jgi:hypothetical protein
MKKLKILHVGNIANNAYLNAKLLRERGHECHVACNDFYHFAGCSEWLDLSTPIERGAFGDPNFPNFWRLGTDKPPTPKWFAQGPESSVLNYLYLLNCGNDRLTDIAWNVLQYQKLKVIYKRNSLAYEEIWNKQKLDIVLDEMNIDQDMVADVVGGLVCDTARYLVYDWNRRASINASTIGMLSFPVDRSRLVDYAFYDPPIRALLDADISGQYLSAIGLMRRQIGVSPDSVDRLARHPGSENYSLHLEHWRELFGFYDIIMAYGASPIIPYLAAVPHFVAYEHGTLRDLPFDGSIQGDLIAASYEHAKAVFITNNDYLDQTRQLKIALGRLHCLPHAFDERPLRDYIASNPVNTPDTVTFFAPARQDWIKQFPSMTKNNHFIVHAARKLVDERHKKFRVIFVDWGDDVLATKKLIAELRLEAIVDRLRECPCRDRPVPAAVD